MIPGILISVLTFPGVVPHEFAHKITCDLFKIKVLEVKYFVFKLSGGEAGYVIHESPTNYLHTLLIGSAPLLINSFVALLLGFMASLNEPDTFFWYLFIWLGTSCGVHAFPSNQDMDNVRQHGKNESMVVGLFSNGIYGLMVVLNFGRMFWLDFLYAILLMSPFMNLSD